jgi:hypothetical protein
MIRKAGCLSLSEMSVVQSTSEPTLPLGFIPEIRLADRVALPAWQKAILPQRSAMINFCEMMERGFLKDSRLRYLRRKLGDIDALVLCAVGRDQLLDELDPDKYHETALRLHVDWLITPDDYIYDVDHAYPYYQFSHFSRTIRRLTRLFSLAQNHYGVIGLAKGVNMRQLQEYVAVTSEVGVRHFALHCGDSLKHVKERPAVVQEIGGFIRLVKDLGFSVHLLGVDSPRILSRLPRPDSYSSSAWSIDAHHRRSYTQDGRLVRNRMVTCNHSMCKSRHVIGLERFAIHNLLVNCAQWQVSGGV